MKKVIKAGKSGLTIVFCFLMLQCIPIHSSGERISAEIQDLSTLTGFNSIGFNISGTLYVEQGSAYSVRIEGNDVDVKKVVAELRGETLIIKTKSNNVSLGTIKVYVTMPEVKRLDVSGSGDIIAQGTLKSQEIEFNVSGSGNIKINNLEATNTGTSISGSGDISISGKNEESLKINIAGSGKVSSEAFESKNVDVDIAGSGSAKVNVTDNLKTNIAGSGDVYYRGKPLVNASSVGSGSTRSME